MSTDPAKIADVEQRAQALQSQQDTMQNTQSQAPSYKSMHHKKSHGKSSGTTTQ